MYFDGIIVYAELWLLSLNFCMYDWVISVPDNLNGLLIFGYAALLC